jgi:DNA invertase Pin-like site-specific DNA recombinase
MVYGYIRVSTEEQNLENQKKAILERFVVESWVEEKRSGTVDYKKRNLGGLVELLQQGDTLIVTELSRLGRSLTMIFNIISVLKEKKVRVIAIKNNFDMNSEGQNDIVSSVLLFAFGLSAQIERELISERTKQGLAVARAKGKRIGRQFGEKPRHFKLTPYKDKIRHYLAEGRTVNSMAEEFGVSWLTMKNFVTVNINVEPLPPLTEKPKRHGHPTYREIEYFKTHRA